MQTTKQDSIAQARHYMMPLSKERNRNVGGMNSVAAPKLALMMNVNHEPKHPLLRAELGEVLRGMRLEQGRTLREVSSDAQVSLGYLSEVERGQKEASSELLESICGALGVPLWKVLREVSDRLALFEQTVVPDTVPDELLADPACVCAMK